MNEFICVSFAFACLRFDPSVLKPLVVNDVCVEPFVFSELDGLAVELPAGWVGQCDGTVFSNENLGITTVLHYEDRA